MAIKLNRLQKMTKKLQNPNTSKATELQICCKWQMRIKENLNSKQIITLKEKYEVH